MSRNRLGDTTFPTAVARALKPSSPDIRKVADLFCGTGGTTIAARAEGLEVVYAEDQDALMRDVYKSNTRLIASEHIEVINFDKIPDFGLLVSQVPDDAAFERVLTRDGDTAASKPGSSQGMIISNWGSLWFSQNFSVRQPACCNTTIRSAWRNLRTRQSS